MPGGSPTKWESSSPQRTLRAQRKTKTEKHSATKPQPRPFTAEDAKGRRGRRKNKTWWPLFELEIIALALECCGLRHKLRHNARGDHAGVLMATERGRRCRNGTAVFSKAFFPVLGSCFGTTLSQTTPEATRILAPKSISPAGFNLHDSGYSGGSDPARNLSGSC